MTRRLWHFLSGYVVIKVKGPDLERFLSRLARAGVPAWHAERVAPHMLVARVSASRFRQVRRLSRGQGWRVSIAAKAGLPFAISAILRRKMLLAGAFLFAAALFAASKFVWFVQVQGDAEGLQDRILAVAAEQGLSPGTLKRRIDPDRLQRALLLEIDELAWAAVSVRGTLAVVEVAERTVARTPDQAGNVVAASDGVVEQVRAFRGVAVVQRGDTVRAGDILISGFYPPGTEEHRRLVEEGKPPYVRADGAVRGRMFYEGEGRAYLASVRETETGRRAAGFALRAGEKEWRLGSAASPFPEYAEERNTWSARLPGGLIVSVERLVFREVERSLEEIDRQTAVASAEMAALVDLAARVPPGAEVVDGPHVEVDIRIDGGRPVAVARAWAAAVGELGRFVPIEH